MIILGNVVFEPLNKSLKGSLLIPGDKSISHRAIMIGSLAKGKTEITNFLDGEDCLRTIKIFQQFGVEINQQGTNVQIKSNGYADFKEPLEPLYFGNSGTTARLMLGILAGLPFHTVMYGDQYLTERPMDRVVIPLKMMNASIDGRENSSYLPLAIRGQKLSAIDYDIPVESAQVKSALIFASLFAEQESSLTEKALTRDHTENMINAFGGNIQTKELNIKVTPKPTFRGRKIQVPGDISSAAFFLVAGAIVRDSNIQLENVGFNKSRNGIITVLEQMGANLSFKNESKLNGEPVGDLVIKKSELQAVTISGEIIPKLIDEIPIIALLATQASGKTIIKDAEELRVKETDRIKAIVETLTSLGADVEETFDGLIINGPTKLKGGAIKSYGDHRMAMMGIIASLICDNNVTIDSIESITISYPNFIEHLNSLILHKESAIE